MIFINPIEILELQNCLLSDIDKSTTEEAKRKFFADIDLSGDDFFDYKGIRLSKTDCATAIDDLEKPRCAEFFLYLATDNQPLNDFLATGDERFFMEISRKRIYKLSEFVDFVSPYFAPRFASALLNAFIEFEGENVKTTKILQKQFLISQADIDLAFGSLSAEITNRVEQIEKIAREIKKTTDRTDNDTAAVENLVENQFPVAFLNILPPYFQSQISKIASAINKLQLAVWENLRNQAVCGRLLEHLLALNLENGDKQTFEKEYETIKQTPKITPKNEKQSAKIEKTKNKQRKGAGTIALVVAGILIVLTAALFVVARKTNWNDDSPQNNHSSEIQNNGNELDELPKFDESIEHSSGLSDIQNSDGNNAPVESYSEPVQPKNSVQPKSDNKKTNNPAKDLNDSDDNLQRNFYDFLTDEYKYADAIKKLQRQTFNKLMSIGRKQNLSAADDNTYNRFLNDMKTGGSAEEFYDSIKNRIKVDKNYLKKLYSTEYPNFGKEIEQYIKVDFNTFSRNLRDEKNLKDFYDLLTEIYPIKNGKGMGFLDLKNTFSGTSGSGGLKIQNYSSVYDLKNAFEELKKFDKK